MSSFRGFHRYGAKERAAIRAEMRAQLVANARKLTIEDLERAHPDDAALNLMILQFVPTNARGARLVASLREATMWGEALWSRVPQHLRDEIELPVGAERDDDE